MPEGDKVDEVDWKEASKKSECSSLFNKHGYPAPQINKKINQVLGTFLIINFYFPVVDGARLGKKLCRTA